MTKPFLILKLLFLILLLYSPYANVKAQQDCLINLERAEKLFDQGIIEEIPELLTECLKSGFSARNKIRAQRLLILAYLFDNRVEEAETIMKDFLNDNPEYEIQPGDPAEFTTLFSSYRTYRHFSMGLFIGTNVTNAIMLEHYGPYNPDIDKGGFSMTTPEYLFGASANIFLTDNLELNIESIFSRNSFEFENLQYGFAEIYKKETLQRLEFPVSVSYDLLRNQWKPYLRLGASYGLILSASTNYRRSFLNTASEESSPIPIESPELDIKDRRSNGTFNAILGGGIKYRIPRGYFFFDLRYSLGLSKLVNPETRWDQETIFQYYYADGNFQLDHFSFSIGYRYSFYKSVKK